MKLARIGTVSAAALLAGGISIASAKSAKPATPNAAASQGKCWDSATNQIKDKAMNQNQTASGARKPGGVTTGSAPSGAATQSTGSASQRPAAAAGLPNC